MGQKRKRASRVTRNPIPLSVKNHNFGEFDSSTDNQKNSTAVLLYREGRPGCGDKLEAFGIIANASRAAEHLLYSIPRSFATLPHTPKLKQQGVDLLSVKLREAVDNMLMGLVVDVRIQFPVKRDMRKIGFTRCPLPGDAHINSVFCINIDRYGRIRESRLQPSGVDIQRMQSAFSAEVQRAS